MSPNFKLSFVTFLTSILFLSGCASVGRSVVAVPAPASGETAKSNGKEVFINMAIDKRIFELKPNEPSTPSLDADEDQSNKIKLRAIARKRNAYGKAMGDILLPEGQTVESLIDATIRQAFIEDGYKVIAKREQITNDTYVVDVQVKKFWLWMNPGIWAITLSGEISTDISVKNKNAIDKKSIDVKASNTFQTGAESNWMEVMQHALKVYISDLKLKLKE